MTEQTAFFIRRPTSALLIMIAAAGLALVAALAPWIAREQMLAANADRQQVLDNLSYNLARMQQQVRDAQLAGPGNGALAVEGSTQIQAPVLLAGDTTGIAGASLQERLTELLQVGRARAESFRVLAPTDQDLTGEDGTGTGATGTGAMGKDATGRGGLVRIGVVVTARFDTLGLRDFLLAVEKERPLLIIDAVQIRIDSTQGATAAGVGAEVKEQLLATIEVHGFMAQEGAI